MAARDEVRITNPNPSVLVEELESMQDCWERGNTTIINDYPIQYNAFTRNLVLEMIMIQ